MSTSTSSPRRPKNPIRLGDAFRAVRELIANPDRTDKVFVIISALSGNSGERQFQRFASTPVGRRVLSDKRDLLNVLMDREALYTLPEGTLGRAYANFMTEEQISADGLASASEEGGDGLSVDIDRDRFGMRMRDSHDLWHTTTGYSRDLLGEAALLAFTFAQTRNPGVGFIVAVAYLKAGGVPGARKLIRDGYRRGRRSGWLPAADWEKLLGQPIEDVRLQLGVGELPQYDEMRSEAGETALRA
ncbi:MAG: Coq4 family protein [Myxococcota bacterium]|nr:Coq4 family protein [Myxococcota bacterium]